MAAPIPVDYQYNCRCERDTPIRTSPPYPVEAIDAVEVACVFAPGTPVTLEVVIEYLTSRIYPIEVLEAIDASAEPASTLELLTIPIDGVDAEADLLTVVLRPILQTYTDWPPEAIDASADLDLIELRTLLLSYDESLPEAVDASADVLTISLEPVLVSNVMADEAIDVDADLMTLALVTP